MKKLLATTAMCIVFASGLNGIANASETNISVVYDANNFSIVSTEMHAHMAELGMFRGDFQQLALTSAPDGMYSGWGSRKMVSVIAERY